MSVATVTMDFAHEGDFNAALDLCCKEWSVSALVVKDNGPAGGWPEVELTGSVPNLIRMLRTAWGLEDEEIISELAWAK